MWEGRNILIYKLKLCGKCWWKWVRNMGYRNVDWRLDGEDIFHSPLIGRLWSRLHPRTKTRPVHPPPPDRSIEASVGIQCSLFIVNTPPLPTTHSDISPWLGRCVYCPGRWRKVESSLLAVDWLIWVQNVGKHFAAVYEPAPLHRRRRAVVKIVGASRLFSIVLAGSWARDASNCLIFTAPASELLNCMRG